jgi:hypothetical protein
MIVAMETDYFRLHGSYSTTRCSTTLSQLASFLPGYRRLQLQARHIYFYSPRAGNPQSLAIR